MSDITEPEYSATAGGIASTGALYGRATPVPAPAVLQATAQLCGASGTRRIAAPVAASAGPAAADPVPAEPAPAEPAPAAQQPARAARASPIDIEPGRTRPAQILEPCDTGDDALAVCRALDRPLEALSSLIEVVVASHPHQSEGLRALLERVGNQAAVLHALVQRALAESASSLTGSAPGASATFSAGVASIPASAPAGDAAPAAARAPAAGSASVPARDVGQRAALRKLTEREHQVLVLVADGLATAEIAHRLGITSATVRSHVQNILTRLGVCNRRQAAALLTGRLPPPAKARLRAARRVPVPPRPQVELEADPSRPQQIRLAAAAPVQHGTSTRRSVRSSGATSSTVTRLTSREVQVLRCLAAGLGRSEIAERLYVSPHTARTHIQRVLAKLGVHSALGAMAVARDVGLAPAT
nr:helix-turn-helix transcriptional regulator [Actinospica robiniae]